MFTVIIPILYLTEYSRKAILVIKQKAKTFKHIYFLLSCRSDVRYEVEELFDEVLMLNNLNIISFNGANSNGLRKYALSYVRTQYVFYQDCDDIVYYDVLLEGFEKCDGTNVVCFNIRKKMYDEQNSIVKDQVLYTMKTGHISKIQNLPTNIVNKLIPLSTLQKIAFYNIHFSQDLSLSFQLFDKAEHLFNAKIAYLYESNLLSTSGIKKTKYSSLLRVVVMEKLLLSLCSQNKYNKSYIKYRYELLLQSRFAYLGKLYLPSASLPIFSIQQFGIKGVGNHLYHYMKSYISCCKLLIKNLFYAHPSSI